MRPKQKPEHFRRIALQRIEKLFREAEKRFPSDAKLANRYVYLARRLSMKYKVPVPRLLKRRFCSHCFCYLVPGVNARVRLRQRQVVTLCRLCNGYTRIPYVQEQKAAKKNS